MKQGKGNLGIYIEEERQQRAGLFLRNVAYIIYATFEMTDAAGTNDNMKKFEEMFERRVANGQCHHMPCFGNREFSAFFASVDGTEMPIEEPQKDLGYMLFDMDFNAEEIPALFFRAEIKNGAIKIPSRESLEVRQ
jgi:CRISPR-associated protein Cas5d